MDQQQLPIDVWTVIFDFVEWYDLITKFTLIHSSFYQTIHSDSTHQWWQSIYFTIPFCKIQNQTSLPPFFLSHNTQIQHLKLSCSICENEHCDVCQSFTPISIRKYSTHPSHLSYYFTKLFQQQVLPLQNLKRLHLQNAFLSKSIMLYIMNKFKLLQELQLQDCYPLYDSTDSRRNRFAYQIAELEANSSLERVTVSESRNMMTIPVVNILNAVTNLKHFDFKQQAFSNSSYLFAVQQQQKLISYKGAWMDDLFQKIGTQVEELDLIVSFVEESPVVLDLQIYKKLKTLEMHVALENTHQLVLDNQIQLESFSTNSVQLFYQLHNKASLKHLVLQCMYQKRPIALDMLCFHISQCRNLQTLELHLQVEKLELASSCFASFHFPFLLKKCVLHVIPDTISSTNFEYLMSMCLPNTKHISLHIPLRITDTQLHTVQKSFHNYCPAQTKVEIFLGEYTLLNMLWKPSANSYKL